MGAVKAALQAIGMDDDDEEGGGLGRKRSSVARTHTNSGHKLNRRKSLVRHRSERTYFTAQEIDEVLKEKKDELVFTKQGEEHDAIVETDEEEEE